MSELEVIEEPITHKGALKPGASVAVQGLNGRHHMVVKDEGYAETLDGKLGAFLRFKADDRNCWTCTSLINTKVFKYLKATQP